MRKKPHAEHHAPAVPPAPLAGELLAAESGVPTEPAAEVARGTGGPGAEGEANAAGAAAGPAVGGMAGVAEAVEPTPPSDAEATAQLERETADLRDRLLRTAADFDNFRKRAAKDKAETWGRAQADLLQKVLDSMDDLGRVAHLDPAQTSAESLHEGIGLVERKLLKALEGVGLERMDPSGQAFDPNAHEAVMTTPTPAAEQDGHVAMVFQAGYRLNGLLLRPARVAVYAFSEALPGEMVH
jgi:molecular chaperone GrpE